MLSLLVCGPGIVVWFLFVVIVNVPVMVSLTRLLFGVKICVIVGTMRFCLRIPLGISVRLYVKLCVFRRREKTALTPRFGNSSSCLNAMAVFFM